jgi:hypothetical protein
MVQVLKKREEQFISISDTQDVFEIKRTLETLLYVPNNRLKPKLIEVVLDYLQGKFNEENYKIKCFIAYYNSEPCGFVISDLNPEYKSYSRKCGTFGWLCANDVNIVKGLLKNCETFARDNKLHRIRGPINFPKNIGGLGIETEGFQEAPLYGVALNASNSNLYNMIVDCGYDPESEYTCLKVMKESWKKGRSLAPSLKLCCITLKELIEKLEEIGTLAKDSFTQFLPDTSGGSKNVLDLIHLATSIPKPYFHHQFCYNPFKAYKGVPEFIEAWKEADLENMVTVFPMVLERKTNKLVGMLIGVLDYYQMWTGKYISRVNVHTAMVRKGYNGKGVFSSLNNFGQATNRSMRGVSYYEGTYIWTKSSKGLANQDAIMSIFPHCSPIRKHIVFQKYI